MQPSAFSLCVFLCGLTCPALWSCWREYREEKLKERPLCLRLANTAVPASLRHPSLSELLRPEFPLAKQTTLVNTAVASLC